MQQSLFYAHAHLTALFFTNPTPLDEGRFARTIHTDHRKALTNLEFHVDITECVIFAAGLFERYIPNEEKPSSIL